MIDCRRLAHRAVADGISDDLGDVALAIAEPAQCFRHRAVDDLEVAAAGELLELHQREIGLDAGGVAVHHQADGAGRRHHGRLRVAIAVRFAERDSAIPGALGMRRQVLRGDGLVVERHRRGGDLLVAGAIAISGAAMIAHHPQHHLAVFGKARERPKLGCHFGRGGVADAGHDRRQRRADGAAGVGIVRNARRHQEAADIGIAQAQECGSRRSAARSRATGIAPSAPRFPARWSTAAPHARNPRRRKHAFSVSWKERRLSDARLHAVSSRNMYSEHGLEAMIGPEFAQVCQSLMVVWNCRPGSALAQAAWPIFSHRSRAFTVLAILPPLVRQNRSQSRSASTALRNSSVTRTVLLEFWPETVR